MKNINNFTQWKYGSVDVTFTHTITHQKYLAHIVRSTRSAVDIFNTLHVFTEEPIRKQEIKLKCINHNYICKRIFQIRTLIKQLLTNINFKEHCPKF